MSRLLVLSLAVLAGCIPSTLPAEADLGSTGEVSLVPEARLVASDTTVFFLGSGAVADGDRVLAQAEHSVHLFERSASGWREAAVFTEATEFSFFGEGLALDGDRAAIGVPGEAAVILVERAGEGWTETARLRGPEGSSFGWDLALEGDRLVVGAVFEAGGGAAYVYERDGAAWRRAARLAPNVGAGGGFGTSVALDGDRIAVGETSEAGGSVSVFEFADEAWARMQTLTGEGEGFGRDVALDGDRLLVGASWTDENRGAAHVFSFADGTWTHQARLGPPPSDRAAHFGSSVALDGDRALVAGIYGNVATVFERTGDTWAERLVLRPAGGTGSPQFGSAADLFGDRVLIGANQNQDGAFTGALFLYALPR